MASTHIYRTFTAGNQDRWTLSMWVKRGAISVTQYMKLNLNFCLVEKQLQPAN